jgi:RNA polymerase sigma-70 factor (ECF subfamily)
MGHENAEQRLSDMSTQWTALLQAQQGTPEAARASEQLLQRYRAPITRYLLACVRHLDVADELFQEFALRFVRGDFKNVDRQRGHFRHFLKTTLYHLVVDYRRKQQRESHLPLPTSDAGPAAAGASVAADADLETEWRKDLLSRTWDALAHWELEKKQPLFTVLKCRTDHPELRAAQLAERLTSLLGMAVTAEWVYKKLHQAREKFSELLLTEVAQTLVQPTAEDLELELLDLGLLEFCRTALDRRRKG